MGYRFSGLPPVFVPLYWIFGRRKFRGYALAKRHSHLEIDEVAHDLLRNFPAFGAESSSNDPRLIALEQLTTLPFCSGNECQFLINGKAAFNEIFTRIDAATDYILLEFYIIRDDQIGKDLAELLIKKAQQGLNIYVVYDEIGSLKLGRQYLQNLSVHGVNIIPFNSTKGLGNRLQLNFRNHRKIVICDGNYAFIGGMNIGDEYRDMHPVLTPWRDTGIAITGPAVLAVQLAFAEDWFWAKESLPKLSWQTSQAEGRLNTLVLATVSRRQYRQLRPILLKYDPSSKATAVDCKPLFCSRRTGDSCLAVSGHAWGRREDHAPRKT